MTPPTGGVTEPSWCFQCGCEELRCVTNSMRRHSQVKDEVMMPLLRDAVMQPNWKTERKADILFSRYTTSTPQSAHAAARHAAARHAAAGRGQRSQSLVLPLPPLSLPASCSAVTLTIISKMNFLFYPIRPQTCHLTELTDQLTRTLISSYTASNQGRGGAPCCMLERLQIHTGNC